jgi:UDP-glucose 4-epimerase
MSELSLVTGGAGFIGSHVVEALTQQGRRVRVLDNFDTGLRSNLDHVRPAPEIVEGDLGEPAAVSRAMAGVGVVYHLGALASVQASVEDPAASHRICATGTVHVLDAARRAGVRRVVYAASASAYGIPAGEVQTEADPVQPLSPYAAAKLAGELYAEAFAATFGLETVRVRFFNIFGPRQRPDSPYSGVIALFTAAMTSGRPPTVYGDGLQSRDFTYVTDAVQALMKAAAAPGVSGRVYNVGTGKSVTVLDLVAALNRLLGTSLSARHGPPRTGDVRHSRADIRRAQQQLGYQPAVSFEEGLRHTLQWYRESAQHPASGGR